MLSKMWFFLNVKRLYGLIKLLYLLWSSKDPMKCASILGKISFIYMLVNFFREIKQNAPENIFFVNRKTKKKGNEKVNQSPILLDGSSLENWVRLDWCF